MVCFDVCMKLFNFKWYEGMFFYGYEGVWELFKWLVNIMGWSVIVGVVDNWVYEDVNSIFIKDEEMCKWLMDLNFNFFCCMVSILLEVNGCGYWEIFDENLEWL